MGVIFTSAAAKRIAAAVRRVEGTPVDRTAKKTIAGPDEGSFWGWITGCDISGMRYNWVRVYPDAGSDTPDLMLTNQMKWKLFGDTPASGFETAYEANSQKGISDVITRLTFAGYNQDGQPTYIFTHQIQQAENGLPLHDHRDAYNGGFAFSCYHPGTDLPMNLFPFD